MKTFRLFSFDRRAALRFDLAAVLLAFGLSAAAALIFLVISVRAATDTAGLLADLTAQLLPPGVAGPAAAGATSEVVLRTGLADSRLPLLATLFLGLRSLCFAFLSFFVPMCFSLGAARAFLPTGRKTIQRLLASALFLLFFLLSLCAQDTGVFLSTLGLAGAHGTLPRVFMGARTLFFSASTVILCLGFISRSDSQISRSIRILTILSIALPIIGFDLRESLQARTINPENKGSNGNPASRKSAFTHRFVLLVPELTHAGVDRLLAREELKPLRDTLRARAAVLPVSDAVLPQVASLVTGLGPTDHGLRSEFPPVDALERARAHVVLPGEGAGPRSGPDSPGQLPPPSPTFNTTVLGTRTTASGLFADDLRDEPTSCFLSVEAAADTRALERLWVPASLMPARVARIFFPDAGCTPRLEAQSDMVATRWRHLSRLLGRKGPLTSLWILGRGFGALPGDRVEIPLPMAQVGAGAKSLPLATSVIMPRRQSGPQDVSAEANLAATLEVFESYFTLLGIDRNFELALVGLRTRTPAADAPELLESAFFAGDDLPRVPGQNVPVVIGTTDLFRYVSGDRSSGLAALARGAGADGALTSPLTTESLALPSPGAKALTNATTNATSHADVQQPSVPRIDLPPALAGSRVLLGVTPEAPHRLAMRADAEQVLTRYARRSALCPTPESVSSGSLPPGTSPPQGPPRLLFQFAQTWPAIGLDEPAETSCGQTPTLLVQRDASLLLLYRDGPP